LGSELGIPLFSGLLVGVYIVLNLIDRIAYCVRIPCIYWSSGN
jgi:hypothetical protein